MTNASLPCSMNSSPTAQPAYGARYWRATGSAAVAATTTEGSIAPGSRPVPLQRRHQRRHLRGLLADRHVDADQVAALLGDHPVQGERRATREAVADAPLSLATADWDHGVHGLDSRVHGAVHALAHHHVGRDALHRPGLVRLDGTFAIQRLGPRGPRPGPGGPARPGPRRAPGCARRCPRRSAPARSPPSPSPAADRRETPPARPSPSGSSPATPPGSSPAAAPPARPRPPPPL